VFSIWVFGITVQGLGKQQIAQLQKAERKIAAHLNLRPYPFNELQSISNIRRNTLRGRIDALIERKVIIEHTYPASKDIDDKVRRGTYYLLNLHNQESIDLITAYYDQPKPPMTIEYKSRFVAFAKRLMRIAAKEQFLAKESASLFKEIEPFMDEDETTPKALVGWFDQIRERTEYVSLLTRTMDIFNIRMRMESTHNIHKNIKIPNSIEPYDLLVRCCIKPSQYMPLVNYSALWDILDKNGLLRSK
jgi:hypothetical protein